MAELDIFLGTHLADKQINLDLRQLPNF